VWTTDYSCHFGGGSSNRAPRLWPLQTYAEGSDSVVTTSRRHRTKTANRTTPEETQNLTGQHATNPTNTVDGIVAVAKVRVAGSNPVVRSKEALILGLSPFIGLDVSRKRSSTWLRGAPCELSQ
jgi:hypothetical protein